MEESTRRHLHFQWNHLRSSPMVSPKDYSTPPDRGDLIPFTFHIQQNSQPAPSPHKLNCWENWTLEFLSRLQQSGKGMQLVLMVSRVCVKFPFSISSAHQFPSGEKGTFQGFHPNEFVVLAETRPTHTGDGIRWKVGKERKKTLNHLIFCLMRNLLFFLNESFSITLAAWSPRLLLLETILSFFLFLFQHKEGKERRKCASFLKGQNEDDTGNDGDPATISFFQSNVCVTWR